MSNITFSGYEILLDMPRSAWFEYVSKFPNRTVEDDAHPEARYEMRHAVDEFVKTTRFARVAPLKLLGDAEDEFDQQFVVISERAIADALNIENFSQWRKDNKPRHLKQLLVKHPCGLIFTHDVLLHSLSDVAAMAARARDKDSGNRMLTSIVDTLCEGVTSQHELQAVLQKIEDQIHMAAVLNGRLKVSVQPADE